MKKNKIHIAIVDDHQIIIDGLVALLKNHPNLKIVTSANSGEEILQLIPKFEIDILLTDVMMPVMSGYELAKLVSRQYPGIKIIALSMSGQGQVVHDMIEDADISGYLLKQTNATELAAAIEKVYEGGLYFHPEVLQELEKLSNQKKEVSKVNITNREKQLIALIENEYSNKQIAEELNISLLTVETHRKNILRKTGTSNVLSLVKWAYENGVLKNK